MMYIFCTVYGTAQKLGRLCKYGSTSNLERLTFHIKSKS